MTSYGKAFHSVGATTEKDLAPYVFKLRSVNSFAMSRRESLSVLSLWLFKIFRLLNHLGSLLNEAMFLISGRSETIFHKLHWLPELPVWACIPFWGKQLFNFNHVWYRQNTKNHYPTAALSKFPFGQLTFQISVITVNFSHKLKLCGVILRIQRALRLHPRISIKYWLVKTLVNSSDHQVNSFKVYPPERSACRMKQFKRHKPVLAQG